MVLYSGTAGFRHTWITCRVVSRRMQQSHLTSQPDPEPRAEHTLEERNLPLALMAPM